MDTITYTEAREKLATLMDQVNQDHAPIIITRRKGRDAVLMSLEDFNAYQETAYLLRSPANARDLLEGIEDLKARRYRQHELVGEESEIG